VKIIAFSGYARSGKDAAAEALTGLGFRRLAFADKLREFVYAINPKVDSNGMITYLRDVIDTYGWDGYKETKWADDIRRILQVVGTEGGRKVIGENVWVDATLNNLEDGKYVFSDVRFPNEADAIRNMGGYVVRIIRPGIEPANNHPSETALDRYYFNDVIHNDKSLEYFQNLVRWLYAEV